jgi:hypothetical protein
MLHAYLDGGLSALDAVRVERHVADCAACRQRLDQARALIQRAARLLEWASPPAERAAPPLADLRPAAMPRWRVPVAWAATIVIALGAGIYGGQILLAPREKGAVQPPPRAEGFDDRRAAPITVVAAAESVPRQDTAKTMGTPAEQTETEPTAGTGLAPEIGAVAIDSGGGLAMARREARVAPARTAPTTPRDSLASRVVQRAFAAPSAAVSGAAENAARFRSADAAPVWLPIGADSARSLLGTAPIAVPDLPVTAMRTLNGVVAVEQVLPPGRVIRLLQRRTASDEEQAPSELLARYVGGLRVEISGPMPPDSLSRLLERARAMP